MLPRVEALTMVGPSDSFESRINDQEFLSSLKVYPKDKNGIAQK